MTLFQIAETLRKQDKFFHSFDKTETIVALLQYEGHCAYCRVDLFETVEALAGGVQTDHLLPRKYDHLLQDPRNLPPACSYCNTLKGDWDANTRITPQVYQPESKKPLSNEQHRGLVKRATEYIAQKRDEKEREFSKTSALWKAALEKRREDVDAAVEDWLDDPSKIAPGGDHKG